MVVLQVKMKHFTSKFPELEVEAQMCTTIQPNVREKLDDSRNLFVFDQQEAAKWHCLCPPTPASARPWCRLVIQVPSIQWQRHQHPMPTFLAS